ncbi:hypothetical protein [Desulforamulus aeronauticus]|uniref:Uncharacterized protein n=1 Tax=Desulforamulus aeronauticus DSM 10349 TaxID=1121421 RepID=A0A1M6Q3I3_9FIRM|nr:hypothetical protein [Desulforamulus aeronauticus]SHK14681.1 hypothetical protein SAMN02745123_00879 [Desulforamulus aeronauticus DSM 10349]
MSIYQFLSSDKPLETVSNHQIEYLSIEEAEQRGISLPNWYSKNMNINRTDKIVLYAPDEECLREIEISDDNDSIYAKQYSNKRYHSALQWEYSEKRAQQLIKYMTKHLMTSLEIELWNVWLDSNGKPTIKKCHIDSLTISEIKEIVEQDPYGNPHCLVVVYQ